MHLKSQDITFTIIGSVALISWVLKFYLHHLYREDCKPKELLPGLQTIGPGDLIVSMLNNSIDKLHCLVPFIYRNKEAEARIPDLSKKARQINYLSIVFLISFSALIIHSYYTSNHY